MVAYGNASGKPEPFDILHLSRLGSLYLTRPRLTEYIATKADLELSATRFFDALERGIVWPHPVERFALAEAPAALNAWGVGSFGELGYRCANCARCSPGQRVAA